MTARAERAAIDRVLDAVRSGLSGTLVLRGGPGVGKSTLLEYAVTAAPDLRVCGIAGVESEISMEFGGLHQLLVPCLPELDDLPPPQRDALRVAFGQEAGPPPERFLVGLAALTLLSRAAEAQPLLCIVDDAHWLDPESAQVLGFVARRLYADRVGLIAGVGEPAAQPVFEQLPAITVDGLPDAEARELLRSVAGGALSAQAVDRILADTRNNPLALVELGTQYTADQLSGRAVLPEPLPLGQRLQEHFLRQVRSLPPDAQAFALLAAADPAGDRDRLWRAADRAGIDPDAASPKRPGPACWSSPAARCGSATRCCGPRCITARAPLTAGRHTVRWPKRATRSCAYGTWPRRRSPPTRSSRPSSSTRPDGRAPGAATRPGPRCCGARPT